MDANPALPFVRLHPRRDQDLPLPAYQSEGAAGMDVHAALEAPLTLRPGETAVVPTGLAVAVPEGCELQVRPRSGLAMKHGITLINAPGTIDSDFRGEIRIGLINLGQEAYTVERGDRIAQFILAPVLRARPEEAASLRSTARGTGGFGHTGR